MRSSVNLTAAPLNGVPSVNLTPFFRLNVYVLASGDTSHFSARPGTNLPGSGSHTRGSQMLSVTRMLVSKLVTCGSSVSSKSPLNPYTSVPPPAAGAGAVVGFAASAAVGATVAGAVVGAAAGGVVGLAAGAAGAAVGAAGVACWHAARPIALTVEAAMSRNSRRRIRDISPPALVLAQPAIPAPSRTTGTDRETDGVRSDWIRGEAAELPPNPRGTCTR